MVRISYGKVLVAGILGLAAITTPAATLAKFRTIYGDMDVELYTTEKPITANNFIRLTREGYYRNNFIHRCIPGFVVQGGGMATTNFASTEPFSSFSFSPNFGQISNEFNIGPRLSNSFGTIAMAKVANNPDSATSQWFFNLGDNSTQLDNDNGGFTVFGRILTGSNVLQVFKFLAYTNGIIDLTHYYGTNSTTSLFASMPVLYAGDRPPQFKELTFVGISLLDLSISNRLDGTRELSWLSATGLEHRVEISTNFPAWETLHTTNGNGSRQVFVDTNDAAPAASYRLQVIR